MELSSEQNRAIEQLYKETFQLLYVYARSVLGNSSLAEDAVQDTFRIACSKPNNLLSSENPKGWLTITFKNVVSNIRKTQALLGRLLVDSMSIDLEKLRVEHAHIDDIDILYSDLLGNEDYQLLKRIAVDHYSMLEAADELNISVEDCKKRVKAAQKRLREYLEQFLD